MFSRRTPLAIISSTLTICLIAGGQDITRSAQGQVPIHLQVDAGAPVHVYLAERVPYRLGAPVRAKLAEPVWSFDRIVLPAGTSFQGAVAALIPAAKMTRAMAIMRGDFTPLKRAQVEFTTMTLPDGRTLAFSAEPSFGLNSIYVEPRPKKGRYAGKLNGKWTGFAARQAQMQANARTHGLLEFVRAPNKREWVEDFMWSKLPYHPQRYRAGTRFDAVLEKPLEFGEVSIAAEKLAAIGTPPPPDAAAQVRFLSTVTSADAHVGDPVAGVLSQPLFSAKHELVLPQGTHLNGKVTQARAARMFHRGGQLRFAFDQLDVSEIASTKPAHVERTQAQLTAAEQANGALTVDSEGTAKATESKARFLRPVIAGLIAAKTLDNDAGKQTATGGGSGNTGGLALGGFSGIGLFGIAAGYAPRAVGQTLGFYGLGWSVFQTVISRGNEVKFEKNAVMAIRFGGVPDRPLSARR
ncbi:MAG: TrbI/VirB10 family protein [Acidobacteriaceae bacterium]|nr:TrbI/VirB10 family protein [Acidobacteriaceae bacterium]